MGAIFKREMSGYFNSAIAYVVLAVYYFFSGWFFYLYCFYGDSASLSYVFANMFYIIMFIIPVLTMKTLSEEKRQKTDQALLTSPVSLTEIVVGKFLGALSIYALCCAIYLVYGVVISFFAQPQWSVVLCTMLGIFLLGAAVIAITDRLAAIHSGKNQFPDLLHEFYLRHSQRRRRGVLPECDGTVFILHRARP